MTLNLMIVAPWGIWQCCDHRLTDPQTGHLMDDSSMKHVAIRCPDGSALITYAGLGKVGDIHLSQWLRQSVRGETRSLDDTLTLIRDEASKWISPVAGDKYHHTFVIGAFLMAQPWAIVISNIQPAADWQSRPPTARFHTSAKRVETEPVTLVAGVRDAVGRTDLELLRRAGKHKPRRTQDFHKLLAELNRRASQHPQHGHLISPACLTAYMPPAGEPIQSRMHGREPRKSSPVPMVFLGIDCTDMEEALIDELRGLSDQGKEHNAAEFQRCVEAAAGRGVHPKLGFGR